MYLKENLEEEEKTLFTLSDLFHSPIQLILRSFIISIKYGFYSLEHTQIYKSIKFTTNLSFIDLLATAI